MKQIRILISTMAVLAAVAMLMSPAMAITMSSGMIKVNPGDVVLDQSSSDFWGHNYTGYDFRFSFSMNDGEAYAQNGNFSSPVLTGWASALNRSDNMAVFDEGNGTKFVCRAERFGNTTGNAWYAFDLSSTGRTIDQLYLTNCSAVWYDNYNTSVKWYISTDATNWHLYADSTTSSTNTFVGSADYYDVTSYVQGSSAYYISVVVDPYWSSTTAEFFRSGGFGGWGTFDNKVWLSDEVAVVSVGTARQLADAPVRVRGIVTAQFNGYYYIEDSSRAAAIRVDGTSPGVGTEVIVNGTLTTTNGERIVTGASVSNLGSPGAPAPVFVTNKAIGGGNSGSTLGVDGGAGLNNIGLLVTTTGKVTAVESGVLTVDDGSGIGLKVTNFSGDWSVGTDLKLTGIVGVYTAGGGRQPMLTLTSGVTTVGRGFVVGASDLTNPDDNFNYRMQYSLVDDKYAQNSNTASPILTGWASGVYTSTNVARVIQWDDSKYLGRASNTAGDPGGRYATVTWKFDFTNTGAAAYNAIIAIPTSVWYDNYNTSATWSVSIDGTNWSMVCQPTSNSANPFVGVAPSYDISEYVYGSPVFYLKADMDPYWMRSCVELFRDRGYDGFDVKVGVY